MQPLDIVIVGAGIGGLEAALALAEEGHQIVVLDSVSEFGEANTPFLPDKVSFLTENL